MRVLPRLAILGLLGALYPAAMLAQQSEDERLIRDARQRSNDAIAAHDLAGIAQPWMPDVHVVSSTSAQTAGNQANQQRMARQFEMRPDTVYVRSPRTIDVFTSWSVASERGEWIGRWTDRKSTRLNSSHGYIS